MDTTDTLQQLLREQQQANELLVLQNKILMSLFEHEHYASFSYSLQGIQERYQKPAANVRAEPM